MMLPLHQVDAFSEKVFGGNPAAVCPLNKWLPDNLMQNIAAENNLAETAFIVKQGDDYEIRWFTPTTEVDLCGHATLASAFVVFNILKYQKNEINFLSRNSGILKVKKDEDYFILDFPADTVRSADAPDQLSKALGEVQINECLKGKTDYLIILPDESTVKNVVPDISLLNKIDARGIIISAPGDKADFVSRFFGPRVGVPEDPVTGSAHTTLIPYWNSRLKKEKMSAIQLSKRKGYLHCTYAGERVYIGGKAALYLSGQLTIDVD